MSEYNEVERTYASISDSDILILHSGEFAFRGTLFFTGLDHLEKVELERLRIKKGSQRLVKT